MSLALPALVCASLARAQGYKLSGPFPPYGGGDALELRVTPDGTRVVYRADETSLDVFELYGAPADGSSARVKLSGPLAAGGDVAEHGFSIDPTGSRVVYRADQDADEVQELYSVPLDGSASPVKLNGPLPAGGDVGELASALEFAISADGSRVVYRADQTTDGRFELYSAPIDGSASASALHPSLPAFANVASVFLLASGPARAVYTADAAVDGRFELFSVPIDASVAPVQLTQIPASSSISAFALTPDGSRAAYVQMQASPQSARLFSVLVDASAGPTELTTASAASMDGLRLTPDGQRAVYRADVAGNGVQELFSVPLDASAAPVRLHPPFVSGRTVKQDSHDVTADSARVLYVADQAADDVFELWSAPSDGSASSVRLNSTLLSGRDVFGVFGTSSVTAGERVVYIASGDYPGELYSVPADGSAGVLELSGTLSSTSYVELYSNDPFRSSTPFGSDHTRVVFARLSYEVNDGWYELLGVPIDASSAPVLLNGPLVERGSVTAHYGWGFAGDRVIYLADQDADEVGEIYSAPVDGSPGRFKLNGPMAPGIPTADAGGKRFTHDGRRVLYLADAEEDDVAELYSVPADGTGSPVKLNGFIYTAWWLGGWVDAFETSGDDEWVVFRILRDDRIGFPWHEIYSAPVDGSVPAVRLDPLGWNFGSWFQISPDGSTVVLTVEGQLFRSPIDGSTAPVALTPSRALVGGYSITPDGSRVVLVMDQDGTGTYELYSLRLDGRAASDRARPSDGSDVRKLSPPLVAGGSVSGYFLLAPDGSRVVYRADREVDERFELYSVPLSGGPSVKLNGPLAAGGDVGIPSAPLPFEISPDGLRVVYLADQLADERFELFSVPIAGGPVAKLNGALVADGDVIPMEYGDAIAIGPDGTRVVYLADQELDERFELYSVPIAGGVAVKLNGSLIGGGDVDAFYYGANPVRLSSDGRFVVYEADQETDDRFELYSRPIDGSGSPSKLNGPLPAGGSVRDFEVSPDGMRVVYAAEQETDEVVELYKVPIGGGPHSRLNGPLVQGGDVTSFSLGPDGQRVAYTADQATDSVNELYASPLERTSPPDQHAGSTPIPTRTVTVVR